MYEGKNPTALQSQKWLIDSLISLMSEKPFSKITVMDICKRADLSRQTFYNFFTDKEEMLRDYLRSQYIGELEKYKDNPRVTISELVSSFIFVLTENEKIFTYMLDNDLEIIIAEEIAACVDTFSEYFIIEEKKDSMLVYTKSLMTGAIGNIFVCWLKQEKRATQEELTALFYDFFQGRIYNIAI